MVTTFCDADVSVGLAKASIPPMIASLAVKIQGLARESNVILHFQLPVSDFLKADLEHTLSDMQIGYSTKGISASHHPQTDQPHCNILLNGSQSS